MLGAPMAQPRLVEHGGGTPGPHHARARPSTLYRLAGMAEQGMAWQGLAGHVNAGRHQPALKAPLLDVVGVAQRSAHLLRARFRARAWRLGLVLAFALGLGLGRALGLGLGLGPGLGLGLGLRLGLGPGLGLGFGAPRSAHAGARGGVRIGRVSECAHSATLRRVRRSVRRRDDGETAQQQARVQAARWLGRLEQHEQHDTHRACGEREHLRAVEPVRWHVGALVQWRSGAEVQLCSGRNLCAVEAV